MWCISLSCIRVVDHDLVSRLYWDLNIFLRGVVRIECILVLDRDRGDADLDKGLCYELFIFIHFHFLIAWLSNLLSYLI
jgi:hypothetical protein